MALPRSQQSQPRQLEPFTVARFIHDLCYDVGIFDIFITQDITLANKYRQFRQSVL